MLNYRIFDLDRLEGGEFSKTLGNIEVRAIREFYQGDLDCAAEIRRRGWIVGMAEGEDLAGDGAYVY